MSSRPRRCSARVSMSSRNCCRASASNRRWSRGRISTRGARRCGRTPRPASWKARPTRRWRSSTSPASPRSRMRRGATLVVDNVFATPLLQKPLAARRRLRRLFRDQAYRRAGPHARRRHPGVSEKFIADAHPQFPAPDRPEPVAVQRLGDAEIAGDAAGARRRADALGRAHRRVPRRAIRASTRVFYPGRADHPQYEVARKQMSGGGTLVAFEVDGGKAAAFAFANALSIIGISNNLGDAKSAHHASRDDDASAAEAGAARRAGHRAGAAAAVGRAGGRGGSGGGFGAGAGVRRLLKQKFVARPHSSSL